MFDFGFGELLLLAVIGLVVLGPERLPVVARLAGMWIRKARAQWNAVKSELENELADEELRRNLRSAADAMREGVQPIRDLHGDLATGANRMTRLGGARIDIPAHPAANEEIAEAVAVRDPAQMSLLDSVSSAPTAVAQKADPAHPDEPA